MFRWSPVMALLAAWLGCGSSSPPEMPQGADASTSVSDVGAGPMSGDDTVGGFAVILVPASPSTGTPAYTTVQGKVFDGPVPSEVVWKVVAQGNSCQLRAPRIPFCDPSCPNGSVCADDRTCVRSPMSQNLGKVNVRGLGTAPFDMDPVLGDYSPPADASLPNPPCAEGADIGLQTSGGAYPPFGIQAKGIAPLELSGPDPIRIGAGQPIQLTWKPGGMPALARIRIKLDISHHGGQKGELVCEVADTGSLEIPATQVSGLVSLGVAGFPTIVVSRVFTGSTKIAPGRVLLTVVSGVERAVEIPGVNSCNTDDECPAGKTCRPDKTCG